MNFFAGGYIFYGLLLTIMGTALYIHGLFSKQMLSHAGIIMVLLGLLGIGLRLPFAVLEWLSIFCFGIGRPILGLSFNQPVRTRIMAYLSTRGESTFNELKQALIITDSNLDSHLKKLLSVKYVQLKKKTAIKGKPQTIYKLTKTGIDAFENYIEALKRLLSPQFSNH